MTPSISIGKVDYSNLAFNGTHFMGGKTSSFMPNVPCWTNYGIYLNNNNISKDYRAINNATGEPYIKDTDNVRGLFEYLTDSIDYLKGADVDGYIRDINSRLAIDHKNGMNNNDILTIIKLVPIPAKYNVRTNP